MKKHTIHLESKSGLMLLHINKNLHWVCVLLIIVSDLFTPNSAWAQIYDAAADYEAGWVAGSNPNGVWSYGWTHDIAGPLTLFKHNYLPNNFESNLEMHMWEDPNNNYRFSPVVARYNGENFDNGNITFLGGVLLLTPGGIDGHDYAHLIWTAPENGFYAINSNFFAQQNNINVDVHILVNGNSVFDDTITSNGQSRPYAGYFTLSAGNTIDFTVGPNGDFNIHPNNVGLDAKIEKVSELPDVYFTPEYFPTAPGNKWYILSNSMVPSFVEVLFNKTTVNGISTRTFVNSYTHEKLYYTSDTEGLRLHKMYLPNVNISGYGRRNLILTANPPVVFAKPGATIGQTFNSSGSFRAQLAGLGSANLGYTANFQLQSYEKVNVPAGSYDAFKLVGSMYTSGQPPIDLTLYLVKGIGIVKQEESAFGNKVTFELQETNAWMHDFAVTKIQAPKTVTLSTPSVTKTVNVTIQNRSPHLETIADTNTLEKLISLQVKSLDSTCQAANVVLPTEKLAKRMPLEIKPQKQFTVGFLVTFDCANDNEKGTGHEDYRSIATVHHDAIDNQTDVHAEDDVCPHAAIEPNFTDPYPDGKIKDKGCGAKNSDGTFGADILTDIVTH